MSEELAKFQALATEDQFRAFIDQSPVFAWAKDSQGRYVYMNRTYLEAFPERLQNWRGKTDAEIWSPETAANFRKNDQHVFQTGTTVHTVEELATSDGGQSYLLSKFPVVDAYGQKLVGGIGVDITEQRRLEKKLRDSEERFRLAEDAANFGHFDWNLQTGRTEWGDSLRRLFVDSPGPETSMLDRIRYVHPEDREDYRTTFERALAGESTEIRISYRVLTPEKQVRHRICGARVHLGEDGRPQRIIGVIADITPQKEAEEIRRLEQERERLEAIIQLMAQPTIIFAADGTWDFANRAANALLDFDACKPRPRTLRECLEVFEFRHLNGTPVEPAELPVHRALQGEVVANFTMRVHNRLSRRTIIASHGASPIFDENGRVTSAVITIHDLTGEMETAARIEQANAALHELSGRLLRLQDEERRKIARDLHDGSLQRITAMAMNLVLIARCPSVMSDKETQNLIMETQTIARQCSHELRTLSYLLHPPDLEEFGLIPALRSWVDGFSQRTGIVVEVTLEDPGRLPRDAETAVFRIAQEALANVHRHSGSTTASLQLTVSRNSIHVRVSDEGCGIPTEILSGNPGRLGVGILGMRERARQLGGELNLASTSTGTVVQAILPRGEASLEANTGS